MRVTGFVIGDGQIGFELLQFKCMSIYFL